MSIALRTAAMTALVGLSTPGCMLADAGPMQHEQASFELDDTELTRVNLRMGVGQLNVKGGAAKLLEATFAYNVAEWKPSVAYTVNGKQGTLDLRQSSDRGSYGDAENKWQLAFNDAQPIDLVANFGVGEARLAIGSLNLRGVSLHVGVGEVDVDLRGTPKQSYRVDINGGVGSATIRVPRQVNITALAGGGIGEIDVQGLERRDGRWVNVHAAPDAPTIRLDIRGGVGEIKILAE